jgi:hypothetical protein
MRSAASSTCDLASGGSRHQLSTGLPRWASFRPRPNAARDHLRLVDQTAGRFVVGDFIPVPCCFPTCNAMTCAFVDGDPVVPLPRVVNVYEYLDDITNRFVPDFSLEIRGALEGLWSSSSIAGSKKSLDQFSLSCQACGLQGVRSAAWPITCS